MITMNIPVAKMVTLPKLALKLGADARTSSCGMVGRAAAWPREPKAARRDRDVNMLPNSRISFYENESRKVIERERERGERKCNGDCF